MPSRGSCVITSASFPAETPCRASGIGFVAFKRRRGAGVRARRVRSFRKFNAAPSVRESVIPVACRFSSPTRFERRLWTDEASASSQGSWAVTEWSRCLQIASRRSCGHNHARLSVSERDPVLGWSMNSIGRSSRVLSRQPPIQIVIKRIPHHLLEAD